MSNNGPGVTKFALYDPPEGQASNSKTMQFVAGVGVSIAAISAGTAICWTSPVFGQLIASEGNDSGDFYLTGDQLSWIGSILVIGAVLGALPAGILAEKFGRKYTTMSLALPYLLGWVLIIFANGAKMLYVGRFVVGIATGASCVVVPMFLSEIAETSIRGMLGTFFQLFLTIGLLFVYVIGPYVSWVTLSVLCAVFPALLIVAMLIVPESPTYLVKQGRRREAAVALKWFWGPNCNTQSAVEAIQSDLDAGKGQARMAVNLKAICITLMLMFFQQASGIHVVIFFMIPMLYYADIAFVPATCAIVIGAVQILATFVSTMLIDKAGRRVLLLQSSFTMSFCLIVLGVYFCMENALVDTLLPLMLVVLFIFSFSLGFAPIPWIMMGELCSPSIKGLVSAVAVLLNWSLVFLATKTFGMMHEQLGSDGMLWFFGFCMLMGTLFVYFVVPETKGKTNAEIQAMLGGRNQ